MGVKSVGNVEKLLTTDINKLSSVFKNIVFIYPALISQSIANDGEVEEKLRRFFAKSLIKELFMQNFDETFDELLADLEKFNTIKSNVISGIENVLKNKINNIDDEKIDRLISFYRTIALSSTTIPIITLSDNELNGIQDTIKKLYKTVEKIVNKDPYYEQYKIEAGFYLYKGILFPVFVGTKKFQADDDALGIILLIALLIDKPIMDVKSLNEIEDIIKRGFVYEFAEFMKKTDKPSYDDLREFISKYLVDKQYAYVTVDEQNEIFKYAVLLDQKIQNALNQLKLVMSDFIHQSLGMLKNTNQKPLSKEEIESIIRNKVIEYIVQRLAEQLYSEHEDIFRLLKIDKKYLIDNVMLIVKKMEKDLIAERIVRLILPMTTAGGLSPADMINKIVYLLDNSYNALLSTILCSIFTIDDALYENLRYQIFELIKEYDSRNSLSNFIHSDWKKDVVDPITNISFADISRVFKNLFKSHSEVKIFLGRNNGDTLLNMLIENCLSYLKQTDKEFGAVLADILKDTINSVIDNKMLTVKDPYGVFKEVFLTVTKEINRKISNNKNIPIEFNTELIDSALRNVFIKIYSEYKRKVREFYQNYVDGEIRNKLTNQLINEVLADERIKRLLRTEPFLISSIKDSIREIIELSIKNVKVLYEFMFLLLLSLYLYRVLMLYLIITNFPDAFKYYKEKAEEHIDFTSIFEKMNKELKLNYVLIFDDRVLNFINTFYTKILIDKYLECKNKPDNISDPECEKVIEILGEDFEEAPPDKKLDFSQQNKKYVVTVLNRIFKFSSIITYNHSDGSVLYIMPFMNKAQKTKIKTIEEFLKIPLFEQFKK